MSDLGRVRSLPRKHTRGQILRPFPAKRGGYLTVGLSRDGASKPHPVHKLVMLTFVGPRPDGLEVRHLDGNVQDPRLSNLAYGTHSENTHDRVRHGTHHEARKTHCKRNHPFDVENTRLWQGGTKRMRQCKTCTRDRNREYERARRARERAAR